MNFEEFQHSLQSPTPPTGLTAALRALWYEGKDDWEKAHQIAQDDESAAGSWVHAYLHRKEGDLGNAAYWYRRAAQPTASGPLRTEWELMVRDLLMKSN
ncbi:hypothetical protein SAMN05421823_103496 [Catalinimonas alkaloidigena]|uniref:Sel1 repeat-containing protein n=1 Tax=Catalinimonas alkaloidigena TaxID=1075417 RepID=A0A1G9EJV8_9BACT|nr:hypothetical protein [Catalinimonas alkaloidigena]SDK76315.1 hypothetical protein SAMN05421823_103496 [Catalinimonas alkaloidigena]